MTLATAIRTLGCGMNDRVADLNRPGRYWLSMASGTEYGRLPLIKQWAATILAETKINGIGARV